MNGVLSVKCKGCGSQKILYLSDDDYIDSEDLDKNIAELRARAEMMIGTSNTTFIDTRGLDYFICSCGNYSSVEEIKKSLKSQKDLHT